MEPRQAVESIQQGRLQQFEELLLKLDPNATASVNVRGGLLGETPWTRPDGEW